MTVPRALELPERRGGAVFFVPGRLAQQEPEMLRRNAARGHEIASHGCALEILVKEGYLYDSSLVPTVPQPSYGYADDFEFVRVNETVRAFHPTAAGRARTPAHRPRDP